jgi:hypothetical protein
MAVTVTHPFVSLVADGGDTTVVQPTNWNATHSLTGTVDVANGGTGASTTAGAPFALKGVNTDLTSVALTTGTVSTTPSGNNDLVNKSYVDAVAQGLDTKGSCVAATTVDITLIGTQTVDTVSLLAGDRCLVKNQSTQSQNGIYVVSASAWTRSTDMDIWAEVPGAYAFIEAGGQQDTGWVCTSNAGGTIDVTAITWTQFSGAGAGVGSLSFGTTGLTPSAVTTGAIVVAGVLVAANGGTGLSAAGTSGNVLTSNGTIWTSAAASGGAQDFIVQSYGIV